MARTPKFSKSGFEFIADTLYEIRQTIPTSGNEIEQAVERFTKDLAATNPRFDPERFRTRALFGRSKR